MKRIIIFTIMLLAMVWTGEANAKKYYDFVVDGICYKITGTNTVSVHSGGKLYKNLKTVTIPVSVFYKGKTYTVTEIGFHAFSYCSELTSVVIPNTIKKIGEQAFAVCEGLTSITIPNSVITIDKEAFSCCFGLTSVTMPATFVSDGAFSACKNITHINIVGNDYTLSRADLCFTKDGISYHVIDAKSVEIVAKFYPFTYAHVEKAYNVDVYSGNITIPESVTCGDTFNVVGIGDYAFCGPKYFSDAKPLFVTIPNFIKWIGHGAFMHSHITSITLPNSITSIRSETFKGCEKLTSVTIPYSVTEIGESAFEDCESLSSIDIPFSVKEIGTYAFKNCDRHLVPFISIYVDKIGAFAFDGCQYIKCQIVDDYGERWNYGKVWNSTKSEFELGKITVLQSAPPFSSFARYYVENGIQEWRKKGEFEKVEDWKKRVTKDAYNEKVKQLTQLAEDAYIDFYKTEQTYSLGTYDTENETFLITYGKYDKFLVPVPFDKASYFKQQWDNATKNTQYFVDNNSIAIASVTFTLPDGSQYKYSNQTTANYEVVQITYDFEPIELDLQESKVNSSSNGKQSITTSKITIGQSDIDINIPVAATKLESTFAVVIANENYQKEAKVPFALNDGYMFAEYCRKALGIAENNVHYVADATLNNIKYEINWLKQVIDAYKGTARVIFYYAGHGIPHEAEKTAYLLPIDGYGTDVTTGFKLDDLYAALGSLPSKSVTVFLDACFSGANRSGEMLASARGVAIKVKGGAPTGNMVVFSAAQGDETAYPNKEQQHGMFTYYLLKKIKDTKGEATYQELSDYITDNVRRSSIVMNGKSQTPVVTPAQTVAEEWKGWKLK